MKEIKPEEFTKEYNEKEFEIELKYDGTQAQVFWDGGKLTILTKAGIDRTERFNHIALEMEKVCREKLPENAETLIVGEIVKFGENEKCVFPFKKEDFGLTKLIAFDIKIKGDYSVRRAELKRLFGGCSHIEVAHRYESFKDGWADVLYNGYEGLVAKLKDASFQLDYGIKMKNLEDKDIVIVNYEENKLNNTITAIGQGGERTVIYDQEAIGQVKARLGRIAITIENLTGTKRFPKFKKIVEG